ncbi:MULTISPECIES: allantoinase AllB [Aminobacter]|uniref:allantoinase AllB n=1 Tax=Aminobacter TaxID=31988 RepID=UPI0012B10571|nr:MULTISPECIES: allantoinase AllB [Aminobacter]MDR7224622.1 allantoinase [Aminobacter aminovorans]MRX37316.1 allantoinase AllB [Aminobacter sp. MDW-2]QNH33925.1 allantoinase AllB [Aminobacter sp. MDW-2]
MDLFIKNVRVITENGSFEGGVAVDKGVIAQITGANGHVDADETIDAEGLYLLPGIIDAHSHFSHPGREFEGFEAGTRASAAGGVTTAIDMPLADIPPMATAKAHAAKYEMVKDLCVADYAFWGGLIDDNLEHLDEQNELGVVAYKAFMRRSSSYPKVDDGQLFTGLQKTAKFGNIVGVHAENDTLIEHLEKRLKAEGRHDRMAWNDSHPIESELEAINRAILLAKAAASSLYIVHISWAGGVDTVREAAHRGQDVYAEVCAHHLCFDLDDYLRVGPRLRSAPPIRSRPEVEELWDRVLRGKVDVIASDHSPFLPDLYKAGENDVWQGTGGITGIQSILPAIITEGVHMRGLSWELLVKMMSSNPARIFGIYPRKGAIVPGADADFALVDPQKVWTLQTEDLFYRYKESPYVGKEFCGRVERTIVRGKTVFLEGKITADKGYGQLVRRESATHGRPLHKHQQSVRHL